MIVGLVDYGVGNLHSLAKAIERGGGTVRPMTDPLHALETDALVLPGVGAFGPAAAALAPAAERLRDALADGFPCLGICLGMQLLFDESEEAPGAGLGVIPGRVVKLVARRTPHIGWNEVSATADPIFEGARRFLAYYANGYVALPEAMDSVIAATEYEGAPFTAAVHTARTWGVQFHPEKSGHTGLDVIRNFLRAAAS